VEARASRRTTLDRSFGNSNAVKPVFMDEALVSVKLVINHDKKYEEDEIG
jgi:hypothetical protein